MMDRELGFDLYTLRLLFLVLLTVTVCSCTVLASLGFYKILHYDLLQGVPSWQGSVLWVSCIYIGFYVGIRAIGRAGWTAFADSADKVANGEPNIFAELAASDLPNVDNFGRL
ncbi:hypothetical protein [Rhizobium sp. MHM7A]|uniref:hypothetical protein n=1 Tax=Rhizobium sp. MHM7A TaxID=2583233 RepID=UPI0011069CA4|nr:hypothetical protein [Rhizobium sp. MHM7A]TLX15881.1 hypothetical protein FFR93_00775 [Rhizobium sp. MHM7A]